MYLPAPGNGPLKVSVVFTLAPTPPRSRQGAANLKTRSGSRVIRERFEGEGEISCAPLQSYLFQTGEKQSLKVL